MMSQASQTLGLRILEDNYLLNVPHVFSGHKEIMRAMLNNINGNPQQLQLSLME